MIYQLNNIHPKDNQRNQVRWDEIVFLYHKKATNNNIGYTTNAITGNGIPKICDAVWLNTLVQDKVLLISQNEGPANWEYAICVK